MPFPLPRIRFQPFLWLSPSQHLGFCSVVAGSEGLPLTSLIILSQSLVLQQSEFNVSCAT